MIGADVGYGRFGASLAFGQSEDVFSQSEREFWLFSTNLAARLQSFAAPGSIVIGPHTRELLGDMATVRELGPHELKGKAATVHLYELLDMTEA